MSNNTSSNTFLKIGIRGHDYGSYDANQLQNFLSEIKQDGFSNVQLVLWKLLHEVSDDLGGLSCEIKDKIKNDFLEHEISVSNLGSYFNVVNSDLEQRERDITRFCQLLKYAADAGFSMVGTETGSVNQDLSFHPDNRSEEQFEQAVTVIQRLVQYAEELEVNVGIEGVEIFTIYDIDSITRLLNVINSPNLRIIFDPVNLIGLSNANEHQALIENAFAAFGDRISLVHFKDFKIENNEIIRVPPGQGVLDYELLIRKMMEYQIPQGVIEEISKEESLRALDYIKEVEKALM